jgi:hypothetical protein
MPACGLPIGCICQRTGPTMPSAATKRRFPRRSDSRPSRRSCWRSSSYGTRCQGRFARCAAGHSESDIPAFVLGIEAYTGREQGADAGLRVVPEDVRYNERSAAERVNGGLKNFVPKLGLPRAAQHATFRSHGDSLQRLRFRLEALGQSTVTKCKPIPCTISRADRVKASIRLTFALLKLCSQAHYRR